MKRHLALLSIAALAGLLLAAKPTKSTNDEAAVGPKSPDDYMTLVGVFVDHAKWDEAMETIADGEKKFPTAAGFHFMRGYVHHKRRNFADAWYEYNYEAMKVGPTNQVGALCAKGMNEILAERGADVDEVRRVMKALAEPKDAKKQLSELQAVESFRGKRAVLTLWIAEAKGRSGDTKGATALYDQLINQDRYFVPAFVGKATLATKAGKNAEAKKLLATAKSIDPTHWALPKEH